MSKLSKDKKYLKLDNMRVSYQHKDDSIHLTTDDKDFQNKSFKISLNKGTQAETALRDLLFEKGLIREDNSINSIPTRTYGSVDSRTPWNEIPLGIGCEGEINWRIQIFPHLLISADRVGSERNVITNSILNHCISHNNKWEVYLHDSSGVHLGHFKKYSNTVKKISRTPLELFYIVSTIQNELMTRYALMEAAKATNSNELKKAPKAILLFIEDFELFSKFKNIKSENKDLMEFLQEETLSKLKDILRLGRAANVHVVSSGYNVEKVIDSEVFQEFGSTLLVGHHTEQNFRAIVGNIEVERLNSPEPGRGIFFEYGDTREIQVYKSSPSALDDWIVEYGKNYEPEVFRQLLAEKIIEENF